MSRPGVPPWWPFPSGPQDLPNKDVLSPAPCRLPGRGLRGGGRWSCEPETAEAALEAFLLVSPLRDDWLTCWAQDGPGAGPFKDLGTKAVAVCAPCRQVQAQLGWILRVTEPICWGMGWAVFP